MTLRNDSAVEADAARSDLDRYFCSSDSDDPSPIPQGERKVR
jgi:hypothetical protein